MTTEKKNPKYDRKTRKKISTAIRKLAKEGLGYKEMLGPLTEMGFTAPNGAPIKNISQLGRRAGIRMRGKRKVYVNRANEKHVETPKTTESDRDVMADLILGADLSDARKIAMLKGLLGK